MAKQVFGGVIIDASKYMKGTKSEPVWTSQDFKLSVFSSEHRYEQ